MFPMLSGLFIKGDNGWVVLAHKTISVPLNQSGLIQMIRMGKVTCHISVYGIATGKKIYYLAMKSPLKSLVKSKIFKL